MVFSLVAITGCSSEPTESSQAPADASEQVVADAPAEAPADEPTLDDGLHVSGLVLASDVSQAKVLEDLGTEDERYEAGTDVINYVWYLDDGTFLTIGFSGAGSLIDATVANLAQGAPDDTTFVVLAGQQVSPDDTLASVASLFPSGEKGEVESMEGTNFLDYTVRFGPEGSEPLVAAVYGVRTVPLGIMAHAMTAPSDRG